MDNQISTKVDFAHFIAKFPEIALPITLTEESHLNFSRTNSPLSQAMIHEYIYNIEDSTFDEFTEFIPCLKLPATAGFHAIIYWRAGLMDYEYTLATFDETGNFLEKKVIAGTKILNGALIRSVTTIDPDWLIYIVMGSSDLDDTQFNPTKNRSLNMELLATGEIITV